MVKRYTLTQPQRAAAILVAMGKSRASQILKFFKSDELRQMIDAAHTLQSIPQPDLEELVQEFEAEFAEGTGILDSADTMRTILADFMPADELEEFIRKKLPEADGGDETDVWALVEQADPEETIAYLRTLPAQVAAVILLKLPSKKTAQLVEMFEEDELVPIMARMLSSRPVSDRVIASLEQQLKDQFKVETGGGNAERASSIANVLNELDRDFSDSVIGKMAGKVDSKKLSLVKSMMFRFEDVVSLTKEARVKLVDGLPSDMLTNALTGATPDITEAILSAIGQRTRRLIESELSSGNEIKDNDIQEARKTIASLALRMASEGRIELPMAA